MLQDGYTADGDNNQVGLYTLYSE